MLLPLSAWSDKALETMALRYVSWLSGHRDVPLADVCYSAATRRAHFVERLVVLADSVDDVLAQLSGFAGGKPSDRVLTGKAEPQPATEPVFVFTGMGPQWYAMGREVLAEYPVCRSAAGECDAIFRELAGWSILDAMCADEQSSRMHEPQVAQPANFVLQVALAALWRSWGIEPVAAIGHSAGEIAAAYVAGALDLPDALAVVYHRSRLQQTAAGAGRMLAVGSHRRRIADPAGGTGT